MEQPKTYENYPGYIVLIATLLQVAIIAIGGFIVSLLGLIWLFIYVIYIIILELKLLKNSCANCYYYCKACAFGKGRLCSILFKRSGQKKFSERKISWKDILPDFMVSIIPLVIGTVFLAVDFNWLILILIIILLILTFIGNGFVRRSLACKFCKQRELGCPAEQLFNKNK